MQILSSHAQLPISYFLQNYQAITFPWNRLLNSFEDLGFLDGEFRFLYNDTMMVKSSNEKLILLVDTQMNTIYEVTEAADGAAEGYCRCCRSSQH